MRHVDPLFRDLRPAAPSPLLRARVLGATAQSRSRTAERAHSTSGAFGGWLSAALLLLLGHAWVTFSSERASSDLLRSLGVSERVASELSAMQPPEMFE
jgi:hypothetical protein